MAPVQRCFSVLATGPQRDEQGRAPQSQLPSLKGLHATALRNQLVALPSVGAADVRTTRSFADAAQEVGVYTPAPILGRFCVTAEVVVSKIFPAGLGWQVSSCVAEQAFGLETRHDVLHCD